jgi:hypothetical protein
VMPWLLIIIYIKIKHPVLVNGVLVKKVLT